MRFATLVADFAEGGALAGGFLVERAKDARVRASGREAKASSKSVATANEMNASSRASRPPRVAAARLPAARRRPGSPPSNASPPRATLVA